MTSRFCVCCPIYTTGTISARDQRQLGPEWYAIDQGFRWMPKHASVYFEGPIARGQKLVVSGYCPAAQMANGPLGVAVTIAGVRLPAVTISQGNAPFSFEFALPAITRSDIAVEVEVQRTFSTSADRRSLGLAFGVFEIR